MIFINLRSLSYHFLSDFQLKMEYEPCRIKLKNLLEDSSFQDLMINVDENYNTENCKYYDTDEYNFMTRNDTRVKIFHLNIRMLARNGLKLQAYLSLFHQRFDVIVLSEIGKEGYRYLSHNPIIHMYLIYPLEIIMGVWLCLFIKNITNLRNDLTLKWANLVIVMIVDMKMYEN